MCPAACPVELLGSTNRHRQSGHCLRRCEHSHVRRDDRRNPAPSERSDRCATSQHFRHHESERLIPLRRHHPHRGCRHKSDQFVVAAMSNPTDTTAESRFDLVGEVGGVLRRTCEHDGQSGLTGGVDGEMGSFLGDEPADPHASIDDGGVGRRRPMPGVDTIRDDRSRHIPPRCRQHRRDGNDVPRPMALSPFLMGAHEFVERRTVQHVHHGHRKLPVGEHGKAVQRVVVHDIECARCTDLRDHPAESSVDDGLRCRAHTGVGALDVAEVQRSVDDAHRVDPVADRFAPVAGEHGDTVPRSRQTSSGRSGVGLESTGIGFAQSESGRTDERDRQRLRWSVPGHRKPRRIWIPQSGLHPVRVR